MHFGGAAPDSNSEEQATADNLVERAALHGDQRRVAGAGQNDAKADADARRVHSDERSEGHDPAVVVGLGQPEAVISQTLATGCHVDEALGRLRAHEADAEPERNSLISPIVLRGDEHVISEPMDFMARLVALVPKPRVNLTRFHGVFAPNSAHRARVTPAKRGKSNKASTTDAIDALLLAELGPPRN